MPPSESDVGRRLRELADHPQAAAGAPALKGLADAVTGTGRDRWIGVDLHQAFAPERIIAEPRESGVRSLLHAAPAVLVFAPLAITWYGLYRAADAFSAAVARDGSVARRSFLELWDTGMAGQLSPTWRFHHVALYAFVAVIVLFGLVALSAVLRSRIDLRHERESEELAARLTAVVFDADLVLAPHRIVDPARFAASLTQAADGLGTLVGRALAAAEMLKDAAGESRQASTAQTDAVRSATSLAGDAQRASSALGTAVADLAARVSAQDDESRRRAAALDAALQRLQALVESSSSKLDSGVEAITRGLDGHAASLGGQVESSARGQQDMAQVLRQSVDLLGASLKQSATLLTSALSQGRELNTDVRSAVEANRSARGELSALVHSLQARQDGTSPSAIDLRALADPAGAAQREEGARHEEA